MIALPDIQLPPSALRRTWVSARLGDLRCGLEFLALLRQLAPAKARGLDPQRPMDCYQVLWKHCATLLPLFNQEFYPEEYDDEPDMTLAGMARDFGIPINFHGVDSQDYIYHDSGVSTAIAVCLCFDGPQEEGPECDLSRINVLKKYRHSLETHIDEGLIPNFPFPGRGRVWQAPWDALELLYLYAHNSTNFNILNISHLMVAETAEGYPQWHIQEIRGWAREWERAQPTLKRINGLRDYIDASPGRRLPLLAGALAGHEPTIEKISRPKPRAKTLAQLFSRTHR